MKKITILLLALILIISVANLSVSKPRSLKDPTEMPEYPIAPSISKEEQKSQLLNELNVISDYFTENKGQVKNDSVRYYIQGAGVWFLDDGVIFEIIEPIKESISYEESIDKVSLGFENEKPQPLKSITIKLKFKSAKYVIPEGRCPLPHKSNFFYGNDSSKWCTDVFNYREIVYKNLYDNIDLKYYITKDGLKYDFIINPGGNPKEIRIRYEGVNKIQIDDFGNLKIETEIGDIIDSKLFIYQNYDTRHNLVEGTFFLYDDLEYGFQIIGDYNPNKILIIDPILNYSTLIGGACHENSQDIAIDIAGNAYVTGWTWSLDFPTTPGALNTSHNGPFVWGRDVFVFKLNPSGSSLVYSTYIGGSLGDGCECIAVDKYGYVYIAGMTPSNDFPITPGAYDTIHSAGFYWYYDAYVLKLNQNGSSIIFSTFVGGNGDELTYGIKLDPATNVFVTGYSTSINFTNTSHTFNSSIFGPGDVFVFKLDSTGSTLLYSTFIGGNDTDVGYDITIDAQENAYITGKTLSSNFPTTLGSYNTIFNGDRDCFIFKLNQNGTKLNYSTYFGGIGTDIGYGIEVDSEGNAFVTGETRSINFPTTPGAYDRTYNGKYINHSRDVFCLKLNFNGSQVFYSTLVGGNDDDWPSDMKIDSGGNAFVTGCTHSPNYPTTLDAFNSSFSGIEDAFIFKINQNGSKLLYSSFFGGNYYDEGFGIDLDSKGIYITGATRSSDFPTTSGAFNTTKNGSEDVFVIKFDIIAINMAPIISSFNVSSASEGTAVIFNVNAYDPDNDPLDYSFDFQGDGIYEITTKNNTVSYVWGDDYSGIAIVKVSDGNHSTVANTTVIVTNAAPKITPFGPIIIKEGSSFNITANVSDPGSDDLNFTWKLEQRPMITRIYYNNGTSPDTYPSPEGTYPFFANDTISHIYGDNGVYNVTLIVQDDDGLNDTYTTTVTIRNVAPTGDIQAFFKDRNASLFVRIAGEKWHNVIVELYKNGSILTNNSLTRYPGSPNDQMLDLSNYTLDSSAFYSVIIRYTPQDDPINGQPNGATPCWVILNFSGQYEIRLHHTFNVKHPNTYIWNVNLTKEIFKQSNNVTFIVDVYDPGSDDITLILDFGDGTNITKFYTNLNNTYPVLINDTFIHQYGSTGTFNITLIAKDDDGGIDTINININVG